LKRVDGRSCPLNDRADLVGDVIDERVGAVPVLLDVGHQHRREGRHHLGLAGHPHV